MVIKITLQKCELRQHCLLGTADSYPTSPAAQALPFPEAETEEERRNLTFLPIQKKRTHRAAKFQRAITGASLAEVMAKRNQKPEVRKAQREQAIRAAKEAKKAKQATKKSTPSTT
ncbi:unnamed protein product [Natator depressus]